MSGWRGLISLFLALVALTSLGCAKRQAVQPDRFVDELDDDMGGAPMMEMMSADSRARSAPKRKSASAPAPAMAPPREAANDAPSAPAINPAIDPTPAAARMVHYDGSATLRVAKVDAAQAILTAIAADAGGLVERQYGGTIILRVPVARFDESMRRVLGVGDVLDKRVAATDVTDQFTATELRLRTATATRARLVALLAKAEDEQDKLFLVREIQRITEEIDRLAGQSRTLSRLASMSRITVQLVPRQQVTWSGAAGEADELRWIRELSPFRPDAATAGRRLALSVPDGMVALGERGPFVAESADGARVWSGRLPNRPDGDAAFWLAAVQERLAPEFASATPDRLGTLSVLRLVSRDDKPYVWVIGVRVIGNRLEVVEVFYPSIEHERRHGPAVRAALAGVDEGAA